MELYNEIQPWGWSEDLFSPLPPSTTWEEDVNNWLNNGIDEFLEVKLDISFLEAIPEVDPPGGEWPANDPLSPPMVKIPPADTLSPPLDDILMTSMEDFGLLSEKDDPLTNLLGQPTSQSEPNNVFVGNIETPPDSPLHRMDIFSYNKDVISTFPESTQINVAMPPVIPSSPDIKILTTSPPSSPQITPIEPIKPSPTKDCNSSKPKNRKTRVNKKNPISKQERKRVQNKEAATRYRIKKRAESEALWDELDELEKRNSYLKEKESDLAREIGYLKKLMKELEERKRCAAN